MTLDPFAEVPIAVRRSPSTSYRNVRWSDAASVMPFQRKRHHGAKKLGVEYEQRVCDVLEAIYGEAFVRAPAIRYFTNNGPKAAILDGLLRLDDQVLIIEVKLAHTERVWEQLMDRYLPLVGALEPGATIRPVEICRSYDPAVRLPGLHTLITSIHENGLWPGRAPCVGLEVLRWRI